MNYTKLQNLEIKINCPYCEKEAPWCENKEKYGKNYGKSYMCYYCKDCDSYVGCHENTRKPLGTMANKELRQWRMSVHEYIDPLWKEGNIKRGSLYRILSEHLGYEYHTGESDIETCKKILAIRFIKKWQKTT
jgi:hypothetical protein